METVDSPCTRACTLDDDDVCIGCSRSLDEIVVWSLADVTQRRAILASADARRMARRR